VWVFTHIRDAFAVLHANSRVKVVRIVERADGFAGARI
jgi:hypothetical protein